MTEEEIEEWWELHDLDALEVSRMKSKKSRQSEADKLVEAWEPWTKHFTGIDYTKFKGITLPSMKELEEGYNPNIDSDGYDTTSGRWLAYMMILSFKAMAENRDIFELYDEINNEGDKV